MDSQLYRYSFVREIIPQTVLGEERRNQRKINESTIKKLNTRWHSPNYGCNRWCLKADCAVKTVHLLAGNQ